MHKIIYKDKEYNSYKEIWRIYGLKCKYVSFTNYIRKYGLEKAMDYYLNGSPKIIYKGKEYNNKKEIWKEYGLKCGYTRFVAFTKKHGLENVMNYYLNPNKIIYRGKEYNSYKEIWKEYGLKCAYATFAKYVAKNGLKETINRFANYQIEKIVYKGKEYNNKKEIWKDYEINVNYRTFKSYINIHGLEKAIEFYTNNYSPKTNIIYYNDKKYKSYKKIWGEYGLKCAYETFIYYIRRYGLEKAIECCSKYDKKDKSKIVYRGKEYKSYKEICRDYRLKCDYRAFVIYVRTHGLEEAIDYYENKDDNKIFYNNKEYTSIYKLWKDYKDQISLSRKLFRDKFKLHLDDIDSFMDVLLEEE